jgi:hypothetical protein
MQPAIEVPVKIKNVLPTNLGWMPAVAAGKVNEQWASLTLSFHAVLHP